MQKSFEVNNLQFDEFGRPSGILLLNKPKWITSHDVVDGVRDKLSTKKVGHAGTLDPFATGLVIVLVGKATKSSADFLNLSKEYKAKVLLGFSTQTGDVEGKIDSQKEVKKFSEKGIEKALENFQPQYQQYVPVFSSVKVKGQKLRKLAHAGEFEIEDKNDSKEVVFYNKDKTEKLRLDLPKKLVKLKIDILSLSEISKPELQKHFPESNVFESDNKNFTVLDLKIQCSKGTYIRQLAMDLGEQLGIPSMLIDLERTKIGDYKISDAKTLEEV